MLSVPKQATYGHYGLATNLTPDERAVFHSAAQAILALLIGGDYGLSAIWHIWRRGNVGR